MHNSIPQTGRRQLILVTGAARSGKSEWAELLASNSTKTVVYIATAIDPDVADPEWEARIRHHQQRRPATWRTLVASIDLVKTIESTSATDCLLIDSLGAWVANLLDRSDAQWQDRSQELLTCLATIPATTIVVAEETGWGVVPAYLSGRLFRDRLGMLSRQIGAIADAVYLIAGGHALNLSQLGTKLPTADR